MVQRFEGLHHTLPHSQRLDLPLPGGPQAMLDLINLGFDALDRDRALFQRTQQA